MYILIIMITHLCVLHNFVFYIIDSWTVCCLEQVFSCEQKLYTRSQLNQHIKTGDSEVDGSEVERGGFVGHPLCEFCKSPFYGENELYTHMTREHYSCHICQRYSATIILLAGAWVQNCQGHHWLCNGLQPASWTIWLFQELWWLRGMLYQAVVRVSK